MLGVAQSGSELAATLRASPSSLLTTVLSTRDPVFCEAVAAHFDVVWIDLEHSALSLSDVLALVIAVSAGGAKSMVRLTSPDSENLGALLDTGVDGIVLPRVETEQQLTEFARRVHFPPLGERGFAPRRASLADGVPTPGQRPACIVQVESKQAVATAERLAAHEVCDALVLGSSDYSFDVSRPMQLADQEICQTLATVRRAAQAHGKGWGLAVGGDPARARALADGGPVIFSSDVRMFWEVLASRTSVLRGAG